MNKDQIIANKLILQANSQSKEIERLKAEIKDFENYVQTYEQAEQIAKETGIPIEKTIEDYIIEETQEMDLANLSNEQQAAVQQQQQADLQQAAMGSPMMDPSKNPALGGQQGGEGQAVPPTEG